MQKKTKTALIMVDLQNDFCPGGSLAVAGGDEIISLANELQPHFDVVVATRDWHPRNHLSFAANHPGKNVGELVSLENMTQILWPIHCVQDSKGAEFHPKLKTHHVHKIIHKGEDKKIDSYSAFFDNAHNRSTGLVDFLHNEHITHVYIMGLATDYCVKYSTLDALKLGFEVFVIQDACRGVELKPGDIGKALQEMQTAGAKLISSKDIIK